AAVSADKLDPQERAGLDALLSRPPAEQARSGAPDRFQYDVTVIAGDRRHHVQLGEREVDGPMRALIDRLEREATPGR
ncbi:MAG: Emfourin, partial [Solirubrobacteraceae bacterium]|nr:Emfourin [Solirubrobacteraceae bacterium]